VLTVREAEREPFRGLDCGSGTCGVGSLDEDEAMDGLDEDGVEGLGLLGDLDLGRTVAPLVGSSAAVLTILGLRGMVNPTQGRMQSAVVRHAPLIGGGVGLLASLVVGMLTGRTAGAVSAAGAAVSAASFLAYDAIRRRVGARIDLALTDRTGQTSSSAPPAQQTSSGDSASFQLTADGSVNPQLSSQAGLGVIVPEYHRLPAQTGAVVMEQVDGLGAAGQTISLGAINPTAFGTPAF
jgi:hypothetical protein